jgi:hypothetical protein
MLLNPNKLGNEGLWQARQTQIHEREQATQKALKNKCCFEIFGTFSVQTLFYIKIFVKIGN